MFTRELGTSGIAVNALGLGCWAIGGPFTDEVSLDGEAAGWGSVDDHESLRALKRALELGLNFIDTADNYGCGHSERIVGEAIRRKRDQVVLATKFGHVCDHERRAVVDHDASPAYIRAACEASLERLGTDYIDVYQFHLGEYPPEAAAEVRETLEQLVVEGKIRYYGWSTDDPERARLFAEGPHCVAIQHALNVFTDNPEVLTLCERYGLTSVNRSPLASGLLTGKFTSNSRFPADDGRADWNFRHGRLRLRLEQVDAIREVLTSNGRTPAQGAIAWLWARSPQTLPIPGFKTVRQVEENADALELGPLSPSQLAEIGELLAAVEQPEA